MNERESFMREALRLAEASVAEGGGPFGAVVVRAGEIVGRGQNRVTLHHDPTAHAEVNAIRDACARLATFTLEGCELYTSCEPCPMCFAAIHWARLERVWYAAGEAQAAAAGFDDRMIREALCIVGAPGVPLGRLLGEVSDTPFAAWAAKGDKTPY